MTILLVLGIILLVGWIAGMGTHRTYGGLVSISLAGAVVLLIVWFLQAVIALV
jgi:hypothetical protein